MQLCTFKWRWSSHVWTEVRIGAGIENHLQGCHLLSTATASIEPNGCAHSVGKNSRAGLIVLIYESAIDVARWVLQHLLEDAQLLARFHRKMKGLGNNGTAIIR